MHLFSAFFSFACKATSNDAVVVGTKLGPQCTNARNQEAAVARASQAQQAESGVAIYPFHVGERQVQERLHVPQRTLDFNSRMVRDWMPDQHRDFFQKQTIMYAATCDEDGRPRACLLAGKPGFVSSPDPKTLCIHTPMLLEGRSIVARLAPGQAIGLLGLEFHTRRRNRLNGTVASATAECVTVRVSQSFGNCPKYIQKRAVTVDVDRQGFKDGLTGGVEERGALGPAQRLLVQDADTFFVATSTSPGASDRGATSALGCDLSHRGGPSGFVQLSGDGRRLRWADYVGNSMFMTLGNLMHNAQVGLLFVDFMSGAALHVDGTARILWDEKSLPGAERIIEVDVAGWSFRGPGSLPLSSSPVYDWSPANPEMQHT